MILIMTLVLTRTRSSSNLMSYIDEVTKQNNLQIKKRATDQKT